MRKLLLIAFLLFPVTVHAIPNITNVSGTVGNNQSVTLTGTDFGPNGPYVVFFDDYERGTNGQTITTNLATMGSYQQVVGTGPNYPTWSNLNRVSGNLAARFSATDYLHENDQFPEIEVMAPTTFDSFYISWWGELPAGNVFPGTGFGLGRNWKVMWVLGPNETTTDADVGLWANDPGNWKIWGNDYPALGYAANFYDVPSGRWERWQVFVRGGTTASTGHETLWVTDTTTTHLLRDRSELTLSPGDENKRRYLSINGFIFPTTGPCYPTFDDVYWAIGENAQARVEIGNAATYTASTSLTMCTTGLGTQGWSDTSVTCTVRAGGFTQGQTGYVYVTKADGTRNATGYPVTFGAGNNGPYTVTASIGSVHGSPAGTIDGVTTPVSKVVSAGTTTSFNIQPLPGSVIYSVSGCGGTLVGNTFTIAPASSDCNINVIFGQIVTPAVSGGGGSLICVSPVPNGEPSSCTATPSGPNHISGASGCGVNWISGSTFPTANVYTNCTVTATFAQNDFLVTGSAGVGGSVSPTSQTVSSGGYVNFIIQPSYAGHTVVISSNTCSGLVTNVGATYTFGPITGGCSFIASFPLTSSSGSGGSKSKGHHTKSLGVNLKRR